MILGGLFAIVLGVVFVWGIVREVRREQQLARDAEAPACCAFCKYEATLEAVSRGKCPECGALYMLAGVEGSHQRVMWKLRSKTLYVAIVVAAFVPSLLVGFASSALMESVRGPARDGDWAAVIGFLVSMSLLAAVPCWLISRRRWRLICQLRERMLPSDQQDRSISKND